MSLIQDALKRQQEETESSRVPLKSAPARNAAPSVPDAMPVPPSPPEPADRPMPVDRPMPEAPPTPPSPPLASSSSPVNPPAIRQLTDSIACPQSLRDSVAGGRAGLEKLVQPGKSWKMIAGIIIVCVLIAWSGGLLLVLILQQPAERTLLGQFMPDLTKPHATSGKSTVQAPATAMSKSVITPASASKPWISPAAAAAPAFADEGEDAAEAAALSGVKEQAGSGAAPETATRPRRKFSAFFSNAGSDQEGARSKPVVWPRLKLSAVFSNMGPGQSGARLNNRLILLGDQIDGVTLIEIRRDSVVLKRGKETRSLKMGMTLN